MTIEKPYFMQNKEWYYFDFDKKKFVLTDKATYKAKKSYKAFYALLRWQEKH